MRTYCDDQGWQCPMTYRGSVDIKLALEEPDLPFDAVWPAHSRWIDLGDHSRRLKHQTSILTSPVVLAVRRSVAQELGLVDRAVSTPELVELVRAGRLKFIATSATQSNSGFSFYIAMLTALSGAKDVLLPATFRSASKPAPMRGHSWAVSCAPQARRAGSRTSTSTPRRASLSRPW